MKSVIWCILSVIALVAFYPTTDEQAYWTENNYDVAKVRGAKDRDDMLASTLVANLILSGICVYLFNVKEDEKEDEAIHREA